MRLEGKRTIDEWIPNFYPSRKVGPDHFLRLSRIGTTQILNARQDAQLTEVRMDQALFERLERTGHIVTGSNSAEVLSRLKIWHQRTFGGPQLHLVVITKRCNLNCTYCHMNPEALSAEPGTYDMSRETADAVIEFALSTPLDFLSFEFQGGEPFVNFEGVRYFVGAARKRAAELGKRLRFSLVSNLMLVKDEHMEFCRDNQISVSYSLNGPPEIHDHFRITRSGAGSYQHVIKKIRYIEANFPGVISTSPLCVVGADNVKQLIPTIEYFHEAGFKGVAILKLKNLGNAAKNRLGFDIHEFMKAYTAALDHLFEKNRRLGENYSERLLRVLMNKILMPTDTGFIDWRNPNGDFNGGITYDYDGEILPIDEARSLRPAFALGNVRDVTYDQLVRGEEALRTMNLSYRDRDEKCRQCAFNPYCGVLPVLDFARTGDPTPVPYQSEECWQTIYLLDWLFAKLVEDPVPLFRMLPGMDVVLMKMLERREAAERDDAAAGLAALAESGRAEGATADPLGAGA